MRESYCHWERISRSPFYTLDPFFSAFLFPLIVRRSPRDEALSEKDKIIINPIIKLQYICIRIYERKEQSGFSFHCPARLKEMEAEYKERSSVRARGPQANNNVGKDRTMPELLAFYRIKSVYPVAGSSFSIGHGISSSFRSSYFFPRHPSWATFSSCSVF